MKKYALTCVIMAAMLFVICLPVSADGEIYYSVKPGDTLYGIGKKFGTGYRTIMIANNLESHTIIPGKALSIPTDKFDVHTVAEAETLFGIARKYGAEVEIIQSANNLTSELIQPGMKLIIPREGYQQKKDEVKPVFGRNYAFTREDIYLLAKLIYAEARGESPLGQVAVGAVIMNRLLSGQFPSSVREIIFQKTKGVYQFTPVQDGQINLEPDGKAFDAAERAVKGEDPTGGALFFYNPEISSDQWIRTLAVKKVIGNHVFAK